MKISELQELLEKAKEEYGDIFVTKFDREWCSYHDIEKFKIITSGIGEIYIGLDG